jgi:hypothetical protein
LDHDNTEGPLATPGNGTVQFGGGEPSGGVDGGAAFCIGVACGDAEALMVAGSGKLNVTCIGDDIPV